MPIERKKLDELLDDVCNKLGGEWVLVGGALAMLEFNASRMTEDIDLFAKQNSKSAENLRKLFLLGRAHGFNEEQLNSAASFFFQEIPNWQNELVKLMEKNDAVIWRPSLTALVYLKLKRSSDIDLEDVRKAVGVYGSSEFDEAKFRDWSSKEFFAKFTNIRESLDL